MSTYATVYRAKSREPEALLRGIREVVEARIALLTDEHERAKPVRKGRLGTALDELDYVVHILNSIHLPKRRHTPKGA